jgi:hypothetical protein
MATSTDLRSAIEEVQGQLPAGQLPAEDQLPLGEGDWASRIERRVGALPWWVISAATHAVLFLLVALLATAVAPPKTDEVIISTDVVKQKPPEYDPQKKRDIFKNTKEVQADTQVENPVVTHEKVEPSDHFETDNNMDKNTSRGSEDAISDIPLGGTGTVGSIGVGGGGMAGVFGYRDGGGRKKAVGRFGGSTATESSVEAALRWLARHQEADGHWDTRKLEASQEYDEGVTGLAVLAFLGAGYTHKAGTFADNVNRAVNWLIKQQDAKGAFARNSGKFGYEHAICGLALAEAYGMTQDPRVREAAQKAVDHSIGAHQEPYSGWRYAEKEAGDTSVTGWFVMQLKSAKVAGLKVDGAGFQGASKFLDSVTGKEGTARYMPDRGPTQIMTAVGLVCRQFMGTPNNDPLLEKGTDYILKTELPDWKPSDYGCFYYWYYGTLATFQMGGKRWENWNTPLKKTLVDNQCKGPLPLSSAPEDKDGSWDLIGSLEKRAGRTYSTAMGALCLEVYYRYLPMYAK